MGLRVNRRIKICKGLHLNVGKNGVSTSMNVGNLTYNSKGRVSVKTGIKGVSYSTVLKNQNKSIPVPRKTFNERIEDMEKFNSKVADANEKIQEVKSNRVNKNIEQWEAIGRKVKFLKPLANLMIKINNKL